MKTTLRASVVAIAAALLSGAANAQVILERPLGPVLAIAPGQETTIGQELGPCVRRLSARNVKRRQRCGITS